MIRIQKFMVAQKVVKATLADGYCLKEVLMARQIIAAATKKARDAG